MTENYSILTATNLGVAYATPSGNDAKLGEIDVMGDWGSRMENLDKIPSVISYSQKTSPEYANWGSDLSPGALAMINTKLELDINLVTDELDLILQALEGVDNMNFQHVRVAKAGRTAFIWRKPEEIVRDYLTKVFQHLLRQINSFSEVVRRQVNLDLVITVPAAVSTVYVVDMIY
jgi:hypothetical protein